jgi:hypothetical protein
LLAVSGAHLTILNYEGVAVAEKCSCRRDFYSKPALAEGGIGAKEVSNCGIWGLFYEGGCQEKVFYQPGGQSFFLDIPLHKTKAFWSIAHKCESFSWAIFVTFTRRLGRSVNANPYAARGGLAFPFDLKTETQPKDVLVSYSSAVPQRQICVSNQRA